MTGNLALDPQTRALLALGPAQLLERVELEQSRRACEASLYEFMQQAWHVIEPGVPFVDSWHLRVICEHLEAITRGQITRLLINIPPRHGKSTIIVMWTMWEWIDRPDRKFLCASYSGSLSIRDNIKARRLIESPWFQARWPDAFHLTGDQNQKGRFENNHTGYRLATSVGGTATGEGGDRLILDDPHGAQDAQSEALRESALEWFDTVWSSRLNTPKTDAMITIMQRLHAADISGRILSRGGWEHVCIPAEWDGKPRTSVLGAYDPRKVKGELICEARFGRTQIDTLKLALGSYASAGQLQQDPTPAEGGILKTASLRAWPATSKLPQFEFVIQSYDGAYTERTTGDPSACNVWGVFTFKNRRHAMLIDAWSEHLAYPTLRARVLQDVGAEYGGSGVGPGQQTKPVRANRVLIENKASGLSLIQDLQRASVPVVPFNPGTADKISRAHLIAPVLEAGMMWIPESRKVPGTFVSWSDELTNQMRQFPRATHDDLVDCAVQAILYLMRTGWIELPKAINFEDPAPPARPVINPYGV